MERRFACSLADLPKGQATTIKFEGAQPVALFRTENGEIYATSDSCTHENWSLGQDSEFDGTEVTCPLHMARFDIRTGQPLCFPATTALDTFTVEVDPDDNVYVLT